MDDQHMQMNGGQQLIHGTPHDDVEGKIFVGGLSWQTTEESMRFHFEKFGELSDIAIMIDKRTGQPRGFGFITMKDPAAADIVVSTEHTIDGRVVDVKRAVPRDMAPAPTRAEAKKIFVGGLPTEVTEKEFADYFGTFGLVKDVVVMVDRATNRSRGFGFVTFETEESVEAVMHSKCEMMGKWIEVKRAEPRDSRDDTRARTMGMGNGMGNGMGMGSSMGMGMQSVGYGGNNGTGRGTMGPGYTLNSRGGAGEGFARGGNMTDYAQQGYQQQGQGFQQGFSAPAGAGRYGQMRYPPGYGGATAATSMTRGGAGVGGGSAYPAADMYSQQPAQPMGSMGYYGYSFGSAAGQPMAGSYGGQSATGSRAMGSEQGGAAGGYGSAASMQGYSYGGASMAGYTGAYNIASGYGATGGGGVDVAQGPGATTRVGQDASFNETGYGAYRGQGAAQGRVDRSYRPY